MRWLFPALALVAGCATQSPVTDADTPSRLVKVLPADMLLLGEQHDDRGHQLRHAQVVSELVRRGELAALALEMAEQGATTAGLPKGADESTTKSALRWNDRGWPWSAYEPAVMAAVRAGVPVLGANLPRDRMRAAMSDDTLDGVLDTPSLALQKTAIRDGHCGLLPEAQIPGMTRVQLARDRAMAQVIASAATPGKTVVLLTGNGHADRQLGVARHLPTYWKVKTVAQRASTGFVAMKDIASYDAEWPSTVEVEPKDHCAELRRTLGQ